MAGAAHNIAIAVDHSEYAENAFECEYHFSVRTEKDLPSSHWPIAFDN